MKRILFILLLCFVPQLCDAQASEIGVLIPADSLEQSPEPGGRIDSMLVFAESFIGCSYGYGQCGPRTFDCSGFVQHVYGKFGTVLPHGSSTQAAACDEIKLKKIRPGDLLFFSGRKVSKKNIGHVAIVHHVDGEKVFMIHATVQSGVIVEEMHSSDYFSRRFIRAGRIRSTKK